MPKNVSAESPPGPAVLDLSIEAIAGALSGAVLMVVFALAGPALLVMVLGPERLENIELTLFGALLGLIVGAPLGAWFAARRRAQRFSLTLAFGGSFLAAAMAITLPTVIAGNAGTAATPWIAALMCTLGTVVFGNLKTWMGR